MQPLLRRTHRLALATIAPRVFAFCHTFGLTVWIAVVEGSGWTLILPGMLLLLWPGVAYALAANAQNSKRAEFRNLLFDSLLFGFWCSVLDFYALATITIGLACLMNNLVVGGLRKMMVSALLFIVAALIGSALTGFTFRPYVSNNLDIYQWAGAVVYFLTIGRVTYSQNRQIGRSIGEIKFQNRVFHALLDLGAVANRAINIHSLLNDSLNHLHTHFPGYGFAVFLQEPQRSEITRYAAVAGLSPKDEQRLKRLLASVHEQREHPVKLPQTEEGENLYIMPMGARLSMYEGWLFVKAPNRDDGLEQILSLFADQLAAATENKLLHLELKKTAERDGLTGLYNRGFLESALQMSIQSKAQTPNLDFAVLMLDVDRLKEVNDHHGHVAGDQLIASVARYLQRHCRDSDVLARYGGDEFVILFPSADLAAAKRMASLIREHLPDQRCTIDTANGEREELALHVSLGCASSSEAPAQQVFALADERMYEDKSLRRKPNTGGPGATRRPSI
ncbi:sensor domain-containing diguanylate cyclase [Vreelandella janggokensis]|jgi:diguanylate cyclase (GGDEF)-like protein|uniref:diguanylate cyclase n=1 Tax=Vreelandella janggokensis TaxID=370767 RepID=A0ABT4IQJ3_9GAMM|nr:GGDEF domain-containing protein [Halomonas janggokensis]MCZ0925929.1 diguanylate cyclase AdrA [Halomonas janggokensis]MCZ0930996.1 diguanylate cyclase AdrA [Halomonas janggokensis]MDR5886400.1 diguanylate cyclase [Halomonas janggokensis]